MPETANIAQVADTVSQKIFSVFGWQRRSAQDQNWACVTPAHKKRTHPSDVIFAYDDPFEHARTYINTDLKSYAKESITLTKVRSALKSMAMSTECANKSEEWKGLYVDPSENYKVTGMLFVYNHDGDFDNDFHSFVVDLKPSVLKLRAGYKMFVIGPKAIQHLYSIANDIVAQRGLALLPSTEDCSFYYPDLIRVRGKSKFWKTATIEMLTSPWQVLKYANGGPEKTQSGYYFYYSGKGDSADEFKFLFDYLFRYQMVERPEQISIRMTELHKHAGANFETAKEQYAKDYYDLPEFKKRLDRIRLDPVATVVHHFNLIAGGM